MCEFSPATWVTELQFSPNWESHPPQKAVDDQMREPSVKINKLISAKQMNSIIKFVIMKSCSWCHFYPSEEPGDDAQKTKWGMPESFLTSC